MTIPSLEGRKVALVHDWLNGMRGGEKCLEVLCELFPDAELYTLIHEKGKLSEIIESMKISTSFIQRMPFGLKKYRHFLPLFPLAIEQFDLNEYDLIVSSSHCVAKGVKHDDTVYHISYIHTPMRYVWDQFDTYFRQPRTSWSVKVAAEITRPYLQRWDRNSSKRVNTFLCNSQNVHWKIRDYYNRESQVIYPPVDLSYFKPGDSKDCYYLMVGAFAPNKRVDLAVKAFNRLKLAFASGGALETVSEKTGIFFKEQTEDALCEAVEEMERSWKDFSPEAFFRQTKQFGRENYKSQMAEAIDKGFREWKG